MYKSFVCRFISSIILLIIASPSLANDTIYCDYYDNIGNFLLTFNENIKVGRSGASNTSGITFIFSEKSNLVIYGTPSAYDINDVSEDTRVPFDIEWFIEKHKKSGCTEYTINANAKRITCGDSIYNLRLMKYKNTLFCVYILYNAQTNEHNDIYTDITSSMIFFENAFERAKAREIVMEAGWPNYNEDDPYGQPRLFCGKNRIRPAIENMTETLQK